jgi:hypothetical protein
VINAPTRRARDSRQGPKPPRRRRGRSGTAAIAATTAIAVLAVVVTVLSYEAATRPPGIRESDLAAVEARLTLLGGQLDDLKSRLAATTKTANKAQATAKLARTGKPRTPNLSVCLYQVQREIDDLQAYLVYLTTPTQRRITGACARLLVPRFTG